MRFRSTEAGFAVDGVHVLLSNGSSPDTPSADHWRPMLASFHGVSMEQVRIDAVRNRPPAAWVAGDRCWLSFSKSRSVRACAFSPRGPVGVDIEHVQFSPALNKAELDHMMALALAPDELERCRRASDEALAFLRIWTAKEAVLKAAGLGLTVDPRRVRTWVEGGNRATLRDITYDVSTATTTGTVLSVATPSPREEAAEAQRVTPEAPAGVGRRRR